MVSVSYGFLVLGSWCLVFCIFGVFWFEVGFWCVGVGFGLCFSCAVVRVWFRYDLRFAVWFWFDVFGFGIGLGLEICLGSGLGFDLGSWLGFLDIIVFGCVLFEGHSWQTFRFLMSVSCSWSVVPAIGSFKLVERGERERLRLPRSVLEKYFVFASRLLFPSRYSYTRYWGTHISVLCFFSAISKPNFS